MTSGNRQLLHYVQVFFQEHLSAHRGLSPNTIFAYRDTLKLYLGFLAQHQRKRITALEPGNLDVDGVLAFLEHGERERNNKTITRNLRLSALRTFFEYMSAQDPLHAGQYQKIVAIPTKKATRSLIEYLDVREVRAILDGISRKDALGRRDYALLSFLYNTGARVQEACDVRVGDVRLDALPLAHVTGKGGKTRVVPLWLETADLLRRHMIELGIMNEPQACLFPNARGAPLTRFGVCYILKKRVADASLVCPSLAVRKISPHTIRHTTAMHLLQSGVDLFVIQSWLGHVNLSTTHAYVEIDLEMKRKALSTCAPACSNSGLQEVIDKNRDVISWLDSLRPQETNNRRYVK